jgi:hypothetical protein
MENRLNCPKSISFLVEASVQTTERNIGYKQRLRVALNDGLGIEF